MTRRVRVHDGVEDDLFDAFSYQVTDETIDILAVRHGRELPETIQDQLAGRRFQ